MTAVPAWLGPWLAVLVMLGCRDDSRREQVKAQNEFGELALPVWGEHFRGYRVIEPAEAGGSRELVLALQPGKACTPGAVRRYILEAAQRLLDKHIDVVHCMDGHGEAAAQTSREQVIPYVRSVAEAVGYSYEEWIAKRFHFSGEVHGPVEPRILPEDQFTDRFAFVDWVSTSTRENGAAIWFDVGRVEFRANKTTWVIRDTDCDILGWRAGYFESHGGHGKDYAYFWTRDGGGRFVVCDSPTRRYLLGVPRTLTAIGLNGVLSHQQCRGGLRCN